MISLFDLIESNIRRRRLTSQPQRQRRTNEHGTFLPTTLNGFYQKSPYLNAPETHIDFQIVLTEEEFKTLASRRRSVRAEAKHASRFKDLNKDDASFLTSQSPYIEPERLVEN